MTYFGFMLDDEKDQLVIATFKQSVMGDDTSSKFSEVNMDKVIKLLRLERNSKNFSLCSVLFTIQMGLLTALTYSSLMDHQNYSEGTYMLLLS